MPAITGPPPGLQLKEPLGFPSKNDNTRNPLFNRPKTEEQSLDHKIKTKSLARNRVDIPDTELDSKNFRPPMAPLSFLGEINSGDATKNLKKVENRPSPSFLAQISIDATKKLNKVPDNEKSKQIGGFKGPNLLMGELEEKLNERRKKLSMDEDE